MRTYLSGATDYIVFARNENEAVEVLSFIAGKPLQNTGKFFYKDIPLDNKSQELIGNSNKAGYIKPHKVENYPEEKCSHGTFLHFYCDKYKPEFIEVDTRLSILNETIDNTDV